MDSLNYSLFQVLHHDPDSLESVFKSALETQGEKSYEIGHVLYSGLVYWVCCILAPGTRARDSSVAAKFSGQQQYLSSFVKCCCHPTADLRPWYDCEPKATKSYF